MCESAKRDQKNYIIPGIITIIGITMFFFGGYLVSTWNYDVYNISSLVDQYNQLQHKTEVVSEIDGIVTNEIQIIGTITDKFSNGNNTLDNHLKKLNKVIRQEGGVSKPFLFAKSRWNHLNTLDLYTFPNLVFLILFGSGILLFLIGIIFLLK